MSADTETEISAETDTETDNFRSLVATGLQIFASFFVDFGPG